MLRLKVIRKELLKPDYNIAGVARDIGVMPYQIRNALKGKIPGYYIVEKLSDYLEKRSIIPDES